MPLQAADFVPPPVRHPVQPSSQKRALDYQIRKAESRLALSKRKVREALKDMNFDAKELRELKQKQQELSSPS